tara:strand:- start:114 stop:365 length:252 start_codon:yes stop_codon:yes gene_type:complete
MYVKRNGRWQKPLPANDRRELEKQVREELADAIARWNPQDIHRELELGEAIRRWYEVRTEHEAERVTRLVTEKLRTEFAEEES